MVLQGNGVKDKDDMIQPFVDSIFEVFKNADDENEQLTRSTSTQTQSGYILVPEENLIKLDKQHLDIENIIKKMLDDVK